ncbi:phosphopantothenoylcysteine decarboxylase-like [Lytechinus variegatus]|uniref:phosphopantothenoylcysteine decarboxylase-like n=1 Tax=Lytechinus variegatus TaxID=7654 RepID=UPI001BB23636|nr:phosphopantothenoylcysteine decarboxylase-like [Lytechinus variegatus]XP_041465362.1 phosphopantothenoylcysteine decarboxylase-like [Lytechinus variegatus]
MASTSGEAFMKEEDKSSSCSNPKKHVLIGCTGSVAAIKIPLLIQEILKIGQVEVKVVVTEHALKFFDMAVLPPDVQLYRDQDEWEVWKAISDPVLHIELRRWADVMVIAPLDANTLGKIASGICDNLLTCVVRAWDMKRPLLFCPSMNTHMWDHPITQRQVSELISLGYSEIPCVEKLLACGDRGFGAMAEVTTIVDRVKDIINR